MVSQYPEIRLLIDGEWRNRAGDIPIINPTDESVLGYLPQATRADLDDALAAAEKGFRVWRAPSPAKRQEILTRATALARQRIDEIATAMTLEQGKTLGQSRLEIQRGCEII